MKHLVMEVLYSEPGTDFDPYTIKPEYESLVTEPKGSMINAFSNTRMEYVVEFCYPEGHRLEGDIVSLHYQHTFNRRNQDGYLVHTATTEQRPDIVLNIKKPGTKEIVLTYLYDVKYRVWNDKRLDIDLEDADIREMDGLGIKGADYPPSDAINQMHRYRDAIYYGTEIHSHSSKEIIGGYVLFPGRGDDDTIANRYYQRSMETINIGAIPLLPFAKSDKDTDKREGAILLKHLKAILNHKSETIKHVERAVPQRGLFYTLDEPKETMFFLAIPTQEVNINGKDFLEGKATSFVTSQKGYEVIKDINAIKYYIPVVNHKSTGYYKVDSIALKSFPNVEPSLRLEFTLKDFIKFPEGDFNFGVDKVATKGALLTKEQLENRRTAIVTHNFDNI